MSSGNQSRAEDTDFRGTRQPVPPNMSLHNDARPPCIASDNIQQPSTSDHILVLSLINAYARFKATGALKCQESDRLFSLAPAPVDKPSVAAIEPSPDPSWGGRRSVLPPPQSWENATSTEGHSEAWNTKRARGRPPNPINKGRARGSTYRPPGLSFDPCPTEDIPLPCGTQQNFLESLSRTGGEPLQMSTRPRQPDTTVPSWRRRERSISESQEPLPPNAPLPVSDIPGFSSVRTPSGSSPTVANQFPVSAYLNHRDRDSQSTGSSTTLLGSLPYSGAIGRLDSFAKLERVPDRRATCRVATVQSTRSKLPEDERLSRGTRPSDTSQEPPGQHHIPNTQVGTFGIRDAGWVEDDWSSIGEKRGVLREDEGWWKPDSKDHVSLNLIGAPRNPFQKNSRIKSDTSPVAAPVAWVPPLPGQPPPAHYPVNGDFDHTVRSKDQRQHSFSSAMLSMLLSIIQKGGLQDIQKMSAAELLERLQSSPSNDISDSISSPSRCAPDRDLLPTRFGGQVNHHPPPALDRFSAGDIMDSPPPPLATVPTLNFRPASSLTDMSAFLNSSNVMQHSHGFEQREPLSQQPQQIRSGRGGHLKANMTTSQLFAEAFRRQYQAVPAPLKLLAEDVAATNTDQAEDTRCSSSDAAADLIRRMTAPPQHDTTPSAASVMRREPPSTPPPFQELSHHLVGMQPTDSMAHAAMPAFSTAPSIHMVQHWLDTLQQQITPSPSSRVILPSFFAPSVPTSVEATSVPHQRVPDPSPVSATTSTVASNLLARDTTEDSFWEYLDPFGKVQGPFRPSQMKTWWEGNFFPNDLLMRYRKNLPWVPFSKLFPPQSFHICPPFSALPLVFPDGQVSHSAGSLLPGFDEKGRREAQWSLPSGSRGETNYVARKSGAAMMTQDLKAILGLEKTAEVILNTRNDDETVDSVYSKAPDIKSRPIEKVSTAWSSFRPSISSSPGRGSIEQQQPKPQPQPPQQQEPRQQQRQQRQQQQEHQSTVRADIPSIRPPVLPQPSTVSPPREQHRSVPSAQVVSSPSRSKDDANLFTQQRQQPFREEKASGSQFQVDVARKATLDELEFPDPSEFFSRVTSAPKRAPIKSAVDLVTKKTTTLREFFKAETASAAARTTWCKPQSSSPLMATGSPPCVIDADFPLPAPTRMKGDSSQPSDIPQPSLAADEEDGGTSSSWVTVSKRKPEATTPPAAVPAVKQKQRAAQATNSSSVEAAEVATTTPAATAVIQQPRTNEATSAAPSKAGLTLEEKVEINKIMKISKIELDDSLLDYLRELKTTDAVVDFLRDSVQDPSVLEHFAREFIAILRNPFRTVSYTKPAVAAWQQKPSVAAASATAMEVHEKNHAVASAPAVWSNHVQKKQPSSTGSHYSTGTTLAHKNKGTAVMVINNSAPIEPKTWAKAAVPSPVTNLLELAPEETTPCSQKNQPPPSAAAKQRGKKCTKGVAVHPSLLGT